MPKALCLISLVASILVVVLFLSDVVLDMAGMTSAAPLAGANKLMDIAFVIFGSALIFLSWTTYREQR